MLRRAQSYIEALSQGVDPLTGGRAGGETLENPRLRRCLQYVAEVLDREAGAAERRTRREEEKRAKALRTRPAAFTSQQLERFEFSAEPIPITEIVRRLNALIEDPAMKPLCYRDVSAFLVDAGALRIAPGDKGRDIRVPTDFGQSLGISRERRVNKQGVPYDGIYYDISAQRFILDNLNSITAMKE